MAVKGLKQTTTRVDQAKRLGGWILIAIIAAALVVGALILSGLFGFVPAPQVTVFGFVLPRSWTAFIGAFTLALTGILSYVYFASLVKSTFNKLLKYWRSLPDWLQALVIGISAGLLAGATLYLTNVFRYWLEDSTMVGVSVGVVLLVTYLTLRVTERGWTLFSWAQILYTSALISGVVSVLTTFAFAGVVPGYTPSVVFLVGWAVYLYLLYRRRSGLQDSVVTRLLTNSGYAQMRQVDTVPVSIGTGLAFAVVVAILVGTVGTTPDSQIQRAGLSVVFVWPVVTLATSIGWPSRDRTELAFEDIHVRDSTQLRELTIRNLGDYAINLHKAKITDANDKLFEIKIDVTLSAGEAAKFEIPEIFELAAHNRYEVFSLPLGYLVTRESDEPTIVTRDGKQYVLRWIDQVQAAEQEEKSEESQ
jgi:hypothetical protein